jgi:hypothetical protein
MVSPNVNDRIRAFQSGEPLKEVVPLVAKLGASGQVAQAVKLLQDLVAQHVRILGADHPNTLHSRLILASFCEVSGLHAQAISDYERLLADAERVLGPNHSITHKARTDLQLARAKGVH